MTTLEIVWIASLAGGGFGLLTILAAKRETGNAALAALLCGAFAAYTAVQIASEGVVGFFTNHTANLTGLQVWIDLIMCTVLALFFIAPRARAAGMNLLPWTLLVGCTASIGLLAMVARLFWLERRAQAAA
ncbi:hypothetical protein AAG596_03560 [Citromicrobium bathyomarinum]|uniref:hypothetical protein n=1 Tax=Citromicrobium bathyomarinum TaxID=72174 RepID=UPI00315A6C87